MPDEDDFAPQPEFWRDEASEDRRALRKVALRWGLLFAAVLAGMVFALWWASEALHFSVSRVGQTTQATYKVTGIVRDAATGDPIPFASIEDDPEGRPPLFRTTADLYGGYTFMTIAEPHALSVSALGYKPAEPRVGKIWYKWFPYGSQRLNISLQPE
jgi:hypothetical protein